MKKIKVDLKEVVKQKYGEIAQQSKVQNESSCCGATSCCGNGTYTIFSDDYAGQKGYHPDADLGLGCGLPTEFANIKAGDSVLDLGSGAGNDCFVAHSLVGESGKVTGLDFTDEMIDKANHNKAKLGFENIEFVKGDIEEMPFDPDSFDVVISNCVLNLVPDKRKAFSEIFRILKPKGHFCISDVVLNGLLPENIKEAAELYAGCVAGALQKEEYLSIIKEAGFSDVQIKKEKAITIPNELLLKYISIEELRELKKQKFGIFSVTITAGKLLQNNS